MRTILVARDRRPRGPLPGRLPQEIHKNEERVVTPPPQQPATIIEARAAPDVIIERRSSALTRLPPAPTP